MDEVIYTITSSKRKKQNKTQKKEKKRKERIRRRNEFEKHFSPIRFDFLVSCSTAILAYSPRLLLLLANYYIENNTFSVI